MSRAQLRPRRVSLDNTAEIEIYCRDRNYIRRVANSGGTSVGSSCVLGAAKTEAEALQSVKFEIDAALKWLILYHGPFLSGPALLHAFQTHELTESYRIAGVNFDVDTHARVRAAELFDAYPAPFHLASLHFLT